jgi:DNA replication protein DnaC
MNPSRQVNMLLLRHHLKALRLPTVSAECEKAAKQCAAEGTDHLGHLLRFCELELIERERKAAARSLKAAKFPAVKTAAEFGFATSPAINRGLVLELLKCEFLSRKENVSLIGGSGTGKTHLATSIAVEACGQGKRV